MKKEIRIGILVIVALGFFFWGLNYLRNNNIFSDETIYYAIYPEIKNLSKSNPVRINGVKVGVVQDIKFPMSENDYRVLVAIAMEKDIPIPVNSMAKIESDLLGSNMINLRLGDDSMILDIRDTIGAEVASTIQEEVSLQMLPVKRKAENLMLQLDSVLEVVKYIFNEETRNDITQSLSSIKATISNLEKTSTTMDVVVKREESRLDAIIGNIQSISGNLKDNNENITRTFENIASISDTVAKARIGETMLRLNKTLDELETITAGIQNGDGSLGKLVNDDTLYYNLEATADNLDALVNDIRLNPQRYLHFSVFGKDPNKTKHKDSK